MRRCLRDAKKQTSNQEDWFKYKITVSVTSEMGIYDMKIIILVKLPILTL